MKKVAIVLGLGTFLMLMVVLGGKLAAHGPHTANRPYELPIYLITLGNFRETPAAPASTACIVNDTEKMPLETANNMIDLVFRYFQHSYPKK
ncbi:MAG: hypothetical protein J7623_15455 [Chitinophaga sp.]|uniref:hypothetical protein n=1 Tax=Chitinophaga sp. TaxID=1869181 RepID=UPI001B0F2B57|nr:hypothetical protein [Chitinophaga sp.]MBO9730033.1 hypothetical protein [Chitinophaga sp.]